MEMTSIEALVLAIGSLGLGMILLIRGGNWTVDAAVYLAYRMGVSPLIVGFTIVAFGTSLPELIIAIFANMQDLPGIAIGNVVGSNIANILLVLGATGVMATIIAVPRALLRDLMMMIAVSTAFAFLLVSGNLGHTVGFSMVAVLALYTLWQYVMARRGKVAVEEVEHPDFKHLPASLGILVAGLICVALGAEFLVRGAKVSAEVVGVPDALIGLTVIAIGTSLPELSTCLAAAMKKQSDLILGNIIGSNVFNVLMIIGVTASIKPMDVGLVASQMMDLDVWVMLFISVLFTMLLLLYRKIDRFVGIMFLGGYAVYMYALYVLYV